MTLPISGGDARPLFRHGRRYTRVVPRAVEEIVERIGGTHPVWDVPLLKVSWLPSVMGWTGPTWCPRWPELGERWGLLAFRPPEFYGTPESWEAMNKMVLNGETILVCGPYPSRGDFELVRDFPPVDLDNAQAVASLVRLVERARAENFWDRRARILGGLDKQKKDWNAYADDVIEDSWSSFYGKPFVSMAGLNAKGDNA